VLVDLSVDLVRLAESNGTIGPVTIDARVYDVVLAAFRREGVNFSRVADATGINRRTCAALFHYGLRISRRSKDRRDPIKEVLLTSHPLARANARPSAASTDDATAPEVTDEFLIASGRRACAGMVEVAQAVIASLLGATESLRDSMAATVASSPERGARIMKMTGEALETAVTAIERLNGLERLIGGQPGQVIEQRHLSVHAAVAPEELRARVRGVLDVLDERARLLAPADGASRD
jgi:hypothetical protein